MLAEYFSRIDLRLLKPTKSIQKQIRAWITPWARAAFALISSRNSAKMSPTLADIVSPSSIGSSDGTVLTSISCQEPGNSQCSSAADRSPTQSLAHDSLDVGFQVAVPAVTFCEFGFLSRIVVEPSCDIREQICCHLGVPPSLNLSFEFLCRRQEGHYQLLPNSEDSTSGIRCCSLRHQDLVTIQYVLTPIKRQQPCSSYLPTLGGNSPVSCRRTTSDSTSFYHSLGFGIVNTHLDKRLFHDLILKCFALGDVYSHLLLPSQITALQSIETSIDMFLYNILSS